MRKRVEYSDLPALALGAAVLGTGGGGDPYLGQLAAQHAFSNGHVPDLIDVEAIDDDMLIVPVAMGGAPAIGLEKLLSETYLDLPVRRLEAYLGRQVDALVPLEIGGVNALLPFMMASKLGLPVVDGDGMGRAFPTLDNTTYSFMGVKASPIIITNEHGDAVVVDLAANDRAEKISRNLIVELGGATCSTLFPMTGIEAKRTVIPGTVTMAFELGRAIERARAAGNDPFTAIAAILGKVNPGTIMERIFEGKIVDLQRTIEGGFNLGSASLAPLDGEASPVLLEFQNEYLRASRDGKTLAIVPDLICCLDSVTADPATCETLRFGQRLTLIAITAPEIMRSPLGLSACGPSAFGFAEAYSPIR